MTVFLLKYDNNMIIDVLYFDLDFRN